MRKILSYLGCKNSSGRIIAYQGANWGKKEKTTICIKLSKTPLSGLFLSGGSIFVQVWLLSPCVRQAQQKPV